MKDPLRPIQTASKSKLFASKLIADFESFDVIRPESGESNVNLVQTNDSTSAERAGQSGLEIQHQTQITA